MTDTSKPRRPSEARKQGYNIQETCYPWIAYKGFSTWPDEWHYCMTDTEEAARKLVDAIDEHKRLRGSLGSYAVDTLNALTKVENCKTRLAASLAVAKGDA